MSLIVVENSHLTLLRTKPNLIANSSFAVKTVGDVLDFWDWKNFNDFPKRVGEEWWDLNCIEVVDGWLKVSVPDGFEHDIRIAPLLQFYEKLDDPFLHSLSGRFTLTFLAKANKDAELTVVTPYDCLHNIDLTTESQLYTIFFETHEKLDISFIFEDVAEYYLSQVQLIKGWDLLEYEESPYITGVSSVPSPSERAAFHETLNLEFGIDYSNIEKDCSAQHSSLLDTEKRQLIVDSQPFFYCGACYLHAHYNKDYWEQNLALLASKGYTVIIPTFASGWNDDRAGDQDMLDFIDIAAANSLRVLVWVCPNAVQVGGSFVRVKELSPSEQAEIYNEETERLASVLLGHSSFLGLYYDEPLPSLIETGKLDEIIAHARDVLGNDYIVSVNYASESRSYLHYQVNGSQPIPVDIVSHTCYPIPVQSVQTAAKRVACGAFFTGWCSLVTVWLQLWSGYGRYPTPDEFTCMAYLAAIYGATGFQTWPMMPSSKLLWDRVNVVISEMKSLENWLYQSQRLNASVDNQYIDFALKPVEDYYVLVTVNFSNQVQNAVITLDDITSISGVEDFFTGDPVPFSGNTISVSYAPYERKVFKIMS